MEYRFDFRPYERRFKRSLSTHHGIWEVREGIILRLIDEEGQVGWGEIAPIPWFGSETLEQALDFCQQLQKKISPELIYSIPNNLPACQFGFESASESFLFSSQAINLPLCALLPAGEAALDAWKPLWNQGYRTFKWKISVYPIAEEIETFHHLTEALPVSAKLRLDANEGLNYKTAEVWLKLFDWAKPTSKAERVNIEFLEQPISNRRFEEMLELNNYYSTPLALDESIANLLQLQACYLQGWRSIFVIKPCIIGSPKRLRKLCRDYQLDLVFSSVFETPIGRKAALKMAAELSNNNRAVGFGVDNWLTKLEENWLEKLWKS